MYTGLLCPIFQWCILSLGRVTLYLSLWMIQCTWEVIPQDIWCLNIVTITLQECLVPYPYVCILINLMPQSPIMPPKCLPYCDASVHQVTWKYGVAPWRECLFHNVFIFNLSGNEVICWSKNGSQESNNTRFWHSSVLRLDGGHPKGIYGNWQLILPCSVSWLGHWPVWIV
jgi:hypothetical protein